MLILCLSILFVQAGAGFALFTDLHITIPSTVEDLPRRAVDQVNATSGIDFMYPAISPKRETWPRCKSQSPSWTN